MKPLLVRLEGLILGAVGVSLAALVFGSHYPFFMNPRYRWLSAVGVLGILLVAGVRVAAPHGKPRVSRSLLFLLLLGLLSLGLPRLSGVYLEAASGAPVNAAAGPQPRQGGPDWQPLEEALDLPAGYVPINPAELFVLIEEGPAQHLERGYVIRGVVRRTAELDRLGEFALLRVFMHCCAADATAVGFRVAAAMGRMETGAQSFPDGQWVRVAGRLEALPGSAGLSEPVEARGVFFTALHTALRLAAASIESIEPPSPPFVYELRSAEPFAY